jgi:hypothetical protein
MIAPHGLTDCVILQFVNSTGTPWFNSTGDHLFASAGHIRKLYDLEVSKPEEPGFLYKLRRYTHLSPTVYDKLKVRFAAQLLSDSVATGLRARYREIPWTDVTIEFVTFFDKLFDMLNSSARLGLKPQRRALQNEKQLMVTVFNFFRKLSIVRILSFNRQRSVAC